MSGRKENEIQIIRMPVAKIIAKRARRWKKVRLKRAPISSEKDCCGGWAGICASRSAGGTESSPTRRRRELTEDLKLSPMLSKLSEKEEVRSPKIDFAFVENWAIGSLEEWVVGSLGLGRGGGGPWRD